MSAKTLNKNAHLFFFLRKYFSILLLLLSVISTKSYSQQSKGKPEYTCSLTGPISTCPATGFIPYTATLQGYNGAIKYQWYLLNNTAGAMLTNSSGITSEKSISINVMPASGNFIPGGHFNLRLIIYRGINADTCYINSHTTPGQTVSINTSQGLQVFTQGNVLLRCPRDSDNVQLSAVATCGTAPYNYLWSTSGDGTFTNVNSPTPVYITGPGDLLLGSVAINIRVTDANGAIANAGFTINIPSCLPVPINPVRIGNTTPRTEQKGESANNNILYQNPGKNIFDFKADDNVTIYPNPNRGTFNIHINISGKVDISLVNKLGITIQKWNNVHSETVQLKGYKPGIYTLLIFDHTTQKLVSKKVVIQE